MQRIKDHLLLQGRQLLVENKEEILVPRISALLLVDNEDFDNKKTDNNPSSPTEDNLARIGNNITTNRNSQDKGKQTNWVSETEFPQYRIMVVDDEPDIISVLIKGLQRHGFLLSAIQAPLKHSLILNVINSTSC